MQHFNEYTKYFKMLSQCTTKCSCGHSCVMYFNVGKTICSHCGRSVYNSKFEIGAKTKFKDCFYKARREINN